MPLARSTCSTFSCGANTTMPPFLACRVLQALTSSPDAERREEIQPGRSDNQVVAVLCNVRENRIRRERARHVHAAPDLDEGDAIPSVNNSPFHSTTPPDAGRATAARPSSAGFDDIITYDR